MITCVCTESRDVYSETFIRDHIERLPGQTIALTGGWPVWEHAGLKVIPDVYRLGMTFGGKIHSSLPGASRRRAELSLAKFLRNRAVDAVLVEYGEPAVGLIESCEAARIPLVAHFHGYDAYHHRVLAEQKEGYERLFRSAAAVIGVSRDMERQLLKLGAPRSKVFYNSCGVDLQNFPPTDPARNPPNFVAVGRFVDKKAPHLTLLAFAEVVKAEPAARLIFAGDGYLFDACQQMARALALDDKVTFLGKQSHEQVGQLMQGARAFVQHSVTTTYGDSEGTPVGDLEASACALPVVATRHCGIADVVQDRVSGWLVDERDIKGMAAGMIEMARNPGLAREWGLRAREYVSTHYAIDKQIRGLASILEIAAGKPH